MSVTSSAGLSLGAARQVIGSFGFPSKMPGTSYALPAQNCIAGATLAKVNGSICSECYALHGKANYQMPRAMIGQRRRLIAINDSRWVDAMVTVLRHYHRGTPIKVDLGIVGIRAQRRTGLREARYRHNEPGFHRWHDSGDLQSVEHYEKILEVCRRTPQIRHWLPTRELAIVRASANPVPDNLTVRVSATMIDGMPPTGWQIASTVHSTKPPSGAWECPARHQDHQCESCRACWSRDIPLVSYPKH